MNKQTSIASNKEQFRTAAAAQLSSARSGASSNLGKLLAMKATSKVMSAGAAKTIIALKKQTPLKWVEMYHIEDNKFIWAKALYLYWACFRGHTNLIKFILEKDRISPFARVYEGRSPLMASLIGKHKVNTVSSWLNYEQLALGLDARGGQIQIQMSSIEIPNSLLNDGMTSHVS